MKGKLRHYRNRLKGLYYELSKRILPSRSKEEKEVDDPVKDAVKCLERVMFEESIKGIVEEVEKKVESLTNSNQKGILSIDIRIGRNELAIELLKWENECPTSQEVYKMKLEIPYLQREESPCKRIYDGLEEILDRKVKKEWKGVKPLSDLKENHHYPPCSWSSIEYKFPGGYKLKVIPVFSRKKEWWANKLIAFSDAASEEGPPDEEGGLPYAFTYDAE